MIQTTDLDNLLLQCEFSILGAVQHVLYSYNCSLKLSMLTIGIVGSETMPGIGGAFSNIGAKINLESISYGNTAVASQICICST